MPHSPGRVPKHTAAIEPPKNSRLTNLFELWTKGETPVHLTAPQLQDFLEKNHRNAESLLAAYRTTRDTNFLKEVMEKFPNNPRVAFEATFFGPPDERRKWLDALKQSAPENALANYLSAADYFKSGQRDQAMQELSAAVNKPNYADYSLDFLENSEEAYRAAGYSDAEAQLAADPALLLPHLAQLKSVGVSLADLATSYQQAGDTASADQAIQMAMALGQRLDRSDSLTLIERLVGIAVQERALKAMDSSDATQQSLAALSQERDGIRQLNQQFQEIVSAPRTDSIAPEQELVTFFQREKLFGGEAAMKWAIAKFHQ